MNGKIYFKQIVAVILWMLCLGSISAAYASNMLENMSFAAMPGDKVQVELLFSEAAPEPGSFTIDSPARIAFDFPDTGVSLDKKRQAIGIGLARSITAVSAGGRTRVVLNLVAMTRYSTEVNGKRVLITLDDAKVAKSTRSLDRYAIRDIDFRVGEEGEGNIIINFTGQPQNVNLMQEYKKLVIDMSNVSLPRELERRLDVNDFNTPVSFIDTYATGHSVKMVVDIRGEFEHLGYQAGNSYTIEVKGVTRAQKEARAKAKFAYTGEKLSLNFQDIEVRAVLQLIADFTGKNLVTSDTVSGSITLRLKNVPWDQALAIILKTKGLGMREEGNVIRVAPAEELAAIEKQELEAKKQIADLLPLVTETIQLQYVTASAVVNLLKDLGAHEAEKNMAGDEAGLSEDEGEGASLISRRGTIIGDDRTNKLIVNDTSRNIAQLRKLITELDTPIKQVLIDARVVSASSGFEKDMGINWNLRSTTNDSQFRNPGQPTMGAGNLLPPNPMGDQAGAFQVDLGSLQKNILGLTFGILGSGYLVDLEISASQVEGTSKLISSPRVVTANGSPAIIKQGTEIPYLAQSGTGGNTSVNFKDAVLSLEVTPLIIPGDKVFMELKIHKDKPSDVLVPIGFGSAPAIETKQIETSVLVDNGDTVVLGGVFEHDLSSAVDKVPFLGDIPIIGQAFRVNKDKDRKDELIIFITPKIMDENLSVR
jgi:type IV pilus assembly protein PilQ